MKLLAALLASALIAAPTAAAALDCPLVDPAATDAGYGLSITLAPTAPVVGQPFQMTINACGPDGAAYSGPIIVDADMPAHRHGMNYRPSVTLDRPGVFLARGFLLHMPGAWRFRFRLKGVDGPVRLAIEHTQP